MPRIAANLGYLFTERPFMERFGAAAAAGFSAVELQFVYDQSPSAVKAELARHQLTILGINTPPRQLPAGAVRLSAGPRPRGGIPPPFQQALDHSAAVR